MQTLKRENECYFAKILSLLSMLSGAISSGAQIAISNLKSLSGNDCFVMPLHYREFHKCWTFYNPHLYTQLTFAIEMP